MNKEIIIADYNNPRHCADILQLLKLYSEDPMGGGKPLSEFTQNNLTKTLAKLPHALTIICYIDQQAVGLINGFEGFSTFQCKPLINIHDIIVINTYRRQGICQFMLNAIENIAKEKGCCRLTLEVLDANHAAKRTYQTYGFNGYELDPTMGKALFWEKTL